MKVWLREEHTPETYYFEAEDAMDLRHVSGAKQVLVRISLGDVGDPHTNTSTINVNAVDLHNIIDACHGALIAIHRVEQEQPKP